MKELHFADWEPSKEYKDYARTMKEGNMSASFRCDACGQFGDGYGIHVQWDIGDKSRWPSIDLCPDCAPAVLAPLQAIAVTTHQAAVAEDEPDGSEIIPSFGKSLRGEEHTAEDDAQWTSESDG